MGKNFYTEGLDKVTDLFDSLGASYKDNVAKQFDNGTIGKVSKSNLNETIDRVTRYHKKEAYEFIKVRYNECKKMLDNYTK